MAAQALLAGLLCMTLPETKGQPTEETMAGDARGSAVNTIPIEEFNEEKKGQQEEKVEQPQPQVIEVAEKEKPSSKENTDQSKEIGIENTAF